MPPPQTKTKTSQAHKTHHTSAPIFNVMRPGKTYHLKQPEKTSLRAAISHQLDLKKKYSSMKPNGPSIQGDTMHN